MIRAVGRRIRFSEDSGMACGAFDECSVDAELVLEDKGKRVYLYAQWTDQMPEVIRTETVPESLYEINARLADRNADWEATAAERNRILKGRLADAAAEERYGPYLKELREMVAAEAEAHGYRV